MMISLINDALAGQRHSVAANQTFWRVVDTNSQ